MRDKLKGALRKIKLRRIELIILLLFLLLNLRVLNWFEPGYLIFGGDLRPPVEPNVFLKNALNSWNQVDWGVPSVYSPRMLDPFLSMMTEFQIAGLNAFSAEILTTYLIYVFVSILMFIYIKRVTNGDILAAFIGTVFFISNVHLIVDREQTAVGFMDMSLMILPSLVAFTEGLRRKSLRFMVLSGFLFILTYASFPNYRAPVLCVIAMLITMGTMYLNRASRINRINSTTDNKPTFWKISFDINIIRRYLKFIVVFIIAVVTASVWLVALVSANLSSFLSAFGQAGTPMSVYFGNRVPDVLRLIAEWSFYDGYLSLPYVPYAANYTSNLLLFVLSYVPTVLAFLAVFVSKSRRRVVFFAALATIFLLLTMGSAWPFASFYDRLVDVIPLIRAFRTSTNWIFLVLLTFSVLIGLFASGLWHRIGRKSIKILAVAAIVSVLFYTSYPLLTGEVTHNWMEDPRYQTVHNGGYVPPYLYELNDVLPSQYWTLLMPQRNVYVIYNFTGKGVLAAGNPYPLMISKPFLTTSGTEYVQSPSLNLLNGAYGIVLNGHGNIVPEGKISASSNEYGYSAKDAIDGNYGTRWASTTAQPWWFEIDWNQDQQISSLGLVFQEAYANVYDIKTWDGLNWVTQHQEKSNNSTYKMYTFSQPINTNKLRIEFYVAKPYGMVSLFEIEFNPAYFSNQPDLAPKFLGLLGIKNILVENKLVAGNYSGAEDVETISNEHFSLVQTWDGASLYENEYAQPKIYAATNILAISSLREMYDVINSSDWSTLKNSAFVSSTVKSLPNWASYGAMQMPQTLSWKEISPTRYEITVTADAPFALSFLENFNNHWKATVNGQPIAQSNHIEVNHFANGWLINSTGHLDIVLEYETQNNLAVSVIVSIVLCAAFTVVLVARIQIKQAGKWILLKINAGNPKGNR